MLDKKEELVKKHYKISFGKEKVRISKVIWNLLVSNDFYFAFSDKPEIIELCEEVLLERAKHVPDIKKVENFLCQLHEKIGD